MNEMVVDVSNYVSTAIARTVFVFNASARTVFVFNASARTVSVFKIIASISLSNKNF
jgi:hypothetical protein